MLKMANFVMPTSKQNTRKCGFNERMLPLNHKLTISEVVNKFEILFGSVQSILRDSLNMCRVSVLCLVC